MANSPELDPNARLRNSLSLPARLPSAVDNQPEPAHIPSANQAELFDKIQKTFHRAKDVVAEGESTASWGKTIMWGAFAVGALTAVAAGGLVIAAGGAVSLGVMTILGGGLTAAGAARLLSTTVGMFGVGKTVRGIGISRQRAGNNAMARCLTANTDLAYYDTNHSTEAENLNALRQAISNRGEFFYPVPAAPHVETEIMKINAGLDQSRYEKIGSYIGMGLAVTRDIVTKPIDEVRQLIQAAKK